MKKLGWLTMINKINALGYEYTGDALVLPKGYKRRQKVYRIDRYRGNGLTLKELKQAFDGYEFSAWNAGCQYAPEIRFFYVVNRIYEI